MVVLAAAGAVALLDRWFNRVVPRAPDEASRPEATAAKATVRG
jgi:hypothetical protein